MTSFCLPRDQLAAYLSKEKLPLSSPRLESLYDTDAVKIFLVDGKKVRDSEFIDFTQGGHHLVYNWIPKGEIWIDSEMTKEERPFVIFHELFEHSLMKSGMSYGDAHEEASRKEKWLRTDKSSNPDFWIQKLLSEYEEGEFDQTKVSAAAPGSKISKKKKFSRAKLLPYVKYLLKVFKPRCRRLAIAGSWRRDKATIGDLDFVVIGPSTDKILDIFTRDKNLKIISILWKGPQKLALNINYKGVVVGIQTEFRVTTPSSWGACLLEATGNAEFNIALRTRAARKGWKLNQKGLFDARGRMLAGKTEEEIFEKLKLEYHVPKERTLD